MTTGAWALLAAVLLALGFGGWRAWRDGRFRPTGASLPTAPALDASEQSADPASGPVSAGASDAPFPLAGSAYVGRLGERATLVQFSSAFCAPCRTTRVVLAEVAGRHAGVEHVEIDAEEQLALMRRLGVLRTPTTLVLDAAGVERARAAGAPTRAQVEAALAELPEPQAGDLKI